jgi:hypothetical protein
MTDDRSIEELVQLLEQDNDFRLEWDKSARRYTIWTGYDYRQGWYGKEGGATLRHVLQRAAAEARPGRGRPGREAPPGSVP